MTPIPIDLGTLPSVDRQINNARLFGGFVNPKNEIQLLPNLSKLFDIDGIVAIFHSTFNDRLFVATINTLSYIENGSINTIGSLTGSLFAIRMAENTQNQVIIVNGVGAWVFDQNTSGFVQLNSTDNGFDLVNPVDVIVLNTAAIIVGGTDNEWIVSTADNATTYNANDVQVTDNSMGNLTGVASMNNNLFIFGNTGIQRWVPAIERTTTDFPFALDPSFRDEYGCISTASLVSKNNEIFYLSSSGLIRMMTEQGATTITNDGIENIINSYEDIDRSFGNYFYHKGHFLYQLTFEKNKNAFIYCSKSKKWSESADLILGYSNFPILTDGVYEFNTNYTANYKKLSITTPYIQSKQQDLTQRVTLSTVILGMTQGKNESADKQSCFLQISRDNVVYSNRVRRLFSKVGNRLYQFRWFMNVVNNGFSLRFSIETKQDITITKAFFNIL